MKRTIFALISVILICLFPLTLMALTPEEAKTYSDYNNKISPLSEQLQKDIEDCGNDMACKMQVMFRFQSEMAKIQLPNVPAYQSTECGLLGSPYPNCRPVIIEIRYAFDEKIYEWDDDSVYMSGERSLAFNYTVDGVLGYNDSFTLAHLFQRHPPLKENIRFEDGKYRSCRQSNGIKKVDVNLSLGNVNMNDPRSLISFFDINTVTEGEKASLNFDPFDLVTGSGVDDPKISAMRLPPDGYDEINLDPSELKSLIPAGGHWTFSRSFSKTYDDIGSKYNLHFTVNVISESPKAPLVTGDPNVKEESVLVVSPDEPFKAKRVSKKDLFKPNEKTYTLTNVGDRFLSYTVTANVPWLYPQSDSGDLKPKDSKTLTIKLNNKADLLDEKKHVGTLQFTNTTGGKGSTSRKVILSTGEKWRFSYYGYTYHTIDGGTLAGGLIIYWRTDVDFLIRDGKYQGGQGRSFLVKNKSFSYPPGIFDCALAKGNWIDQQLKDQTTPHVTEANFPVTGKASQGFVTLNFSNISNEYHIHIKCAVDSNALLKNGFTPPKKANYDALHNFAGTMRPTGSRTYPLQDNWLREEGIKGKSKSYEASEIKRLE